MIVLKDRFKSFISEEEIKKYKAQSSRSAPRGAKIFEGKSIDEVTSNGIGLAKKNSRKMFTEDKTLEL